MEKQEKIEKQLEERSKELNALYKIEKILNDYESDLADVLQKIPETIVTGFQFPEHARARLRINGEEYSSEKFKETPWALVSDIKLQEDTAGLLEVYYTKEMPIADEGAFLSDEKKLIEAVANLTGQYVVHRRLRKVFDEWKKKEEKSEEETELNLILEMMKKTDRHLYSILSRKMINHLFCKGVEESKEFFQKSGGYYGDGNSTQTEINAPSRKQALLNSYKWGKKIFTIAKKYLSDDAILALIQKWSFEDKSSFLAKSLLNSSTPLTEIADAIRRFYFLDPEIDDKITPTAHGIKVSLIKRFLTEQLDYINIAKRFCHIKDFHRLVQKMIFPADSQGKLGGKSAGLFLAEKIIEKTKEYSEPLRKIKTPKTWYISSDGVIKLIYYNNLEDIIEHKYKNVEDIRREYPYIIQAFKNAIFPPELANGLSRALDDFGQNPIIVRSSSLLEDSMGSAFAGKYKSLFLANQGSKEERMEALLDAIAEVFASTFGPDPIGYRIERGLLDVNEEMGIMIQEVVGQKIGKYFIPAFAGVAFSHNEFRWSPRIKREDGLIRIVAGLGTRAVDRIGNDYPTLLAPGQPDLRVNQSFDDMIKYSQKYCDLINLETNTFDTVSISQLKKEIGSQYPMINDVFSIQEDSYIRKPIGLGVDPKKDDIIVTFENLVENTDFIKLIDEMLRILSDNLGSPVDIEFACNGNQLYLLQCRPQSSGSERASAVIPDDIDPEKVIFTANKNVSNARTPDINYIVYVDPIKYGMESDYNNLKEVSVVVNKLNKMLPKRSFILMGPGRWGSRDDLNLGVNVTYSDINNTAVLIEVAKQKKNYMPELSFGTHFFQDLVEASISYLPLYPDDKDVDFNEEFFQTKENILSRFLPDYKHLEHIVKVINIRESTGGLVLRLLMNADEDRAMAFLVDPSTQARYSTIVRSATEQQNNNEPLQWRLRMSDSVCAEIDKDRFGIRGVYLFGTVFNETAGPNSDIDLLVHYDGRLDHMEDMQRWFEGWNLCLAHINYNKSGYFLRRILDVHYASDEEIEKSEYHRQLIDPKNNISRRMKTKADIEQK